jgi:hypothetical protein
MARRSNVTCAASVSILDERDVVICDPHSFWNIHASRTVELPGEFTRIDPDGLYVL